MAAFTELDPELIRKALEGHVDVLTPAMRAEEAFFRNSTCPACGSQELTSYINATNPFTKGNLLPNKLLRCIPCDTEFEPYTRIVTQFTPESD